MNQVQVSGVWVGYEIESPKREWLFLPGGKGGIRKCGLRMQGEGVEVGSFVMCCLHLCRDIVLIEYSRVNSRTSVS